MAYLIEYECPGCTNRVPWLYELDDHNLRPDNRFECPNKGCENTHHLAVNQIDKDEFLEEYSDDWWVWASENDKMPLRIFQSVVIEQGPWPTPIVRKENGEPIGAMFFLTDEVLGRMNIELEGNDRLQYIATQDGTIRIDNIRD